MQIQRLLKSDQTIHGFQFCCCVGEGLIHRANLNKVNGEA